MQNNNNTYFNPKTFSYNNATEQTQPLLNAEKAESITISFCLFNNKKDNQAKPKTMPWGEFCSWFSEHKERNQKDGLAWSPTIYKSNCAFRKNDSIEAITMASLDIDEGVDLEAVTVKLQGTACLIHTTFSHTPEEPKIRIIIPFSHPVTACEWPEIWQRLKLWTGLEVDAATKDPSRIYYVPSRPVGAEGHFSRVLEGDVLDVNSLPVLPKKVIPIMAAPVCSYNRSAQETGSKEGLQEVVQRCRFMQFASNPVNQNNLSEPLWMAMISNACRFNDPEWIHEASKFHDGYDEDATDSRIDRHYEQSGPITCRKIQELGFKGCPEGGCKLPSGRATEAPAGLGVWDGLADANEGSQRKEKKSLRESIDDFISSHYAGHLVYFHECFYAYQDGYWAMLDDRADVRQKIAFYLAAKASPKEVEAHLSLMKDLTAIKEMRSVQEKHYICLDNGTLDPISGELFEHSPDYMLRTKLNIDWNTNAKCPTWLKALGDIFAPDIDKAQKIAFLQEWFGYCLIPDSSLHKFVWMVGAGGNGKSVILSILKALVGSQNVSHAQIERLNHAPTRAELESKLVNISSEMSTGATVADGYLKAIVSGDEIEAERKFKPSFSFRPFVRLIGATNELPRLLDLSDGFARRAVFLTFNRQFKEHEQDKQLEAKLLRELPGILQWAVQGLKRLKELGNFEIPQSSNAAVARYRQESDPVQLFANERLREDATRRGVKPAEVYEAYRKWCQDFGYQPMNNINFGKRLSKLGFKSRESGGQKYWLVIINEGDDEVHEVAPQQNYSSQYLM